YGVALQHPPGWKPDPRYPGGERWRGTTGFFQVGATSGCGLSVAEVAQREAEHKLAPYGHLYRIEATTAGGREGRLVLPGPDQPPEMEGQAALFVPYPRPWRIGEETYCHLILWADAGHMRLLAQTLRFAPETASSEPPLDASALRGQGRLALVREGRLYLLVGETGEVRLLDGSGRAAGPAFSPDGEWIAFVRRVPGLAGGTLMLVRAEGGEPSEVQGLPAPVAPGEYAWAPVGSTLAIAPAAATEGEGLWRAAPGEPARRLAAEGERVHGFAWSPDGRTLAYVVTPPADDPLARSDELRLLDVERGESVVRYTAERAGILLTGWWPDGRGLLFWLDPYHSASLAADGLPLLSLGEGEAKARELVTMLPRRDWVAWAPVASGDGATGRNRFVVVEGTSRFLWENKRLALCDAERATCRPLPQPEGTVALDPAWSPDGRRIAFVQAEEMRGRSGGVEDVAHWVEGRALQVMHADGQTAEPVSAAGQGVRQPRWSADDRHLLFVRADGIWLLLAGDGPPRRLASLPEPGQAAIDPLLMGRPDFAWWEGGH
ncbi:MAG: PD40 domain-containing protein, partial [Clostridia bacterium]|nr:PD40 domain-containing protein [Clostridia bacterium]